MTSSDGGRTDPEADFVVLLMSEFCVWYDFGEAILPRDRLQRLSMNRDGAPMGDDAALRRLFLRGPVTRCREESDLLVIRVAVGPVREPVPFVADESLRLLALDEIEALYALSDRAKPVLANRPEVAALAKAVPLAVSDPLAEAWTRYASDRALRNALNGGAALVRLLAGSLGEGPPFDAAAFRERAAPGIRAMTDAQWDFAAAGDPDAQADGFARLMTRVHGFTRKEGRLPRSGGADREFLGDAGELTGKLGSPLVVPLRSWFDLNILQRGARDFAAIWGPDVDGDGFRALSRGFESEFGIPLASLAIFLLWRDTFQERGAVAISRLRGDCQRLSRLPALGEHDATMAAFLFGCFAGHETVAPWIEPSPSCVALEPDQTEAEPSVWEGSASGSPPADPESAPSPSEAFPEKPDGADVEQAPVHEGAPDPDREATDAAPPTDVTEAPDPAVLSPDAGAAPEAGERPGVAEPDPGETGTSMLPVSQGGTVAGKPTRDRKSRKPKGAGSAVRPTRRQTAKKPRRNN